MKKTLVILSGVLLFATASNAQTSDSAKRARAREHISNMDSTHKQNLKDKGITPDNLKDLNLSKDQQEKIAGYHREARQEKEKINNDNTLTQDQKQEKLKAVDQNFKSQTNSILTQEQKDKVKQKRATLNSKNNNESSR